MRTDSSSFRQFCVHWSAPATAADAADPPFPLTVKQALASSGDQAAAHAVLRHARRLPAGERGRADPLRRATTDSARDPTADTGLKVYRFLYHSRAFDGKDVPASGVIILPYGDPPEGGWPVIAWAHGTTGVAADRGAVSRQPPRLWLGRAAALADARLRGGGHGLCRPRDQRAAPVSGRGIASQRRDQRAHGGACGGAGARSEVGGGRPFARRPRGDRGRAHGKRRSAIPAISAPFHSRPAAAIPDNSSTRSSSRPTAATSPLSPSGRRRRFPISNTTRFYAGAMAHMPTAEKAGWMGPWRPSPGRCRRERCCATDWRKSEDFNRYAAMSLVIDKPVYQPNSSCSRAEPTRRRRLRRSRPHSTSSRRSAPTWLPVLPGSTMTRWSTARSAISCAGSRTGTDVALREAAGLKAPGPTYLSRMPFPTPHPASVPPSPPGPA